MADHQIRNHKQHKFQPAIYRKQAQYNHQHCCHDNSGKYFFLFFIHAFTLSVKTSNLQTVHDGYSLQICLLYRKISQSSSTFFAVLVYLLHNGFTSAPSSNSTDIFRVMKFDSIVTKFSASSRPFQEIFLQVIDTLLKRNIFRHDRQSAFW